MTQKKEVNIVAKQTKTKGVPKILKALGTSKTAVLTDEAVALLIKDKTRIPLNTVRRVLNALRAVSKKYSKVMS